MFPNANPSDGMGQGPYTTGPGLHHRPAPSGAAAWAAPGGGMGGGGGYGHQQAPQQPMMMGGNDWSTGSMPSSAPSNGLVADDDYSNEPPLLEGA
jgi:hypothetical protein